MFVSACLSAVMHVEAYMNVKVQLLNQPETVTGSSEMNCQWVYKRIETLMFVTLQADDTYMQLKKDLDYLDLKVR